MTKALLDQGLPRSATAFLQRAGWEAVHVYDLGLSQAPDRDILAYARTQGYFCITLDADFHSLIAVANATAPSVIRIRQEGLRGPELARLVLDIWPRVEKQILQGALVTVTSKAIRLRQLPLWRVEG